MAQSISASVNQREGVNQVGSFNDSDLGIVLV
jgi:hypothetical protein